MNLRISRLELICFRNHERLILDDLDNTVIIVGDNAVGKTNIIEALQLLALHESFRRPKAEELHRWESPPEKKTRIYGELSADEVKQTKQIEFSNTGRTFTFNGKERPARELTGILPAVLFTPDDLQIVKGPPERRRDLIDNLGSHLSRTFAQIRTDYQKALRHKNRLLRAEEVELALLDSWSRHLATLGASLVKHRRSLFGQLMQVATRDYASIADGEELAGIYNQADDSDEESLYREMCTHCSEEMHARRALVGPHRDDVNFSIGGVDARRFASQGQQRSVALALKTAEIEVLSRITGSSPLLLLDDVMSELDAARRARLLTMVDTAGQTVITATSLDLFTSEFIESATVVYL